MQLMYLLVRSTPAFKQTHQLAAYKYFIYISFRLTTMYYGHIMKDHCHNVTTMSPPQYHLCYLSVTSMWHQCHHNVTSVSPQCHFSVTTMSLQGHHNITSMSPKCRHNITLVSAQCHLNVTTMSHPWHQCHIRVTRVTSVSLQCHLNVTVYRFGCLLGFYILATSIVISGHVLTSDCALRSLVNFIVLPHWETSPLAPLVNITLSHIILILS